MAETKASTLVLYLYRKLLELGVKEEVQAYLYQQPKEEKRLIDALVLLAKEPQLELDALKQRCHPFYIKKEPEESPFLEEAVPWLEQPAKTADKDIKQKSFLAFLAPFLKTRQQQQYHRFLKKLILGEYAEDQIKAYRYGMEQGVAIRQMQMLMESGKSGSQVRLLIDLLAQKKEM